MGYLLENEQRIKRCKIGSLINFEGANDKIHLLKRLFVFASNMTQMT